MFGGENTRKQREVATISRVGNPFLIHPLRMGSGKYS